MAPCPILVEAPLPAASRKTEQGVKEARAVRPWQFPSSFVPESPDERSENTSSRGRTDVLSLGGTMHSDIESALTASWHVAKA